MMVKNFGKSGCAAGMLASSSVRICFAATLSVPFRMMEIAHFMLEQLDVGATWLVNLLDDLDSENTHMRLLQGESIK